MRIATYNVEWFNALFKDDDTLAYDGGWSGRYNVRRDQQIDALGIVFNALDADAIMVIEAPDDSRRRNGRVALENFADTMGLRAKKAVIGFGNHTQQEIILMYDPAVLTARHDPRGGDKARFDDKFLIDLDIDAAPEAVSWSKPPLELALETATGRAFRMIGVHAKSKAPHGAKNDKDAMRIAIENRRKQLAQCVWLRQRVDADLAQGDDLIVLGDFNDGPGLDEYEELFGRSGVEIVLGAEQGTRLYDPHARLALRSRMGGGPVSARFRKDGGYLSALLDYVMLSPGMMVGQPRWRIWHPFDDDHCYQTPELREALLIASDHFPVTVDLTL